MPQIENIPKEYESGFVSLCLMQGSLFANLKSKLDGSRFYSDLESLTLYISTYPKLKFDLVYNILRSVSSLYSLIDKNDLKSTDVSQDIAETLKENKKIKTKKVSIKTFESRLTKLLDNAQLYIAFKSEAIYLDHKYLYIEAKILSDIRPVFTKPNINAKAGLIANTLHIHYRIGEQEDDHHDFFIALDTIDLQNLKKAILRAEQKNETLKRMIKKSGMAYLDPSKEN